MPLRLANQAEPIPGYKLIERLGRGGFGEVWKAEAPGGLMKAIKFVYGDMDDVKDKGSAGVQELKALNRVKTVRHPFILSMERVDIVEGQLIIVMELADRNLMDRFRECQTQGLPGVPREELLRYIEEAAEALDLMNDEYGLQHLDIKPTNLFLVRNHIKVADFGLVKDLEGMKATVTGGVTPVYAAPETFEGWVSRFCDQYSLAIVYQELLTGQRPFSGNNARVLLKQHLEQEPDLSALPQRDQQILRRALAKKPTDRYPSCGYLVRLLRGEETGDLDGGEPLPTAAPPPPTTLATASAAPAKLEEGPVEERTHQLGPSKAPPVVDTDRPSSPAPTESPAMEAATITSRVQVRPAAPIDFKGAGVLYPATVIGIGQLGVSVLQKLRGALHERFGSVDGLPHIRLLGIDLDPDTLAAAARSGKGAALASQEMLLTRLNRPGHFLKPREGIVPFQAYLDPQLLYRIPRSQLTTGLRCLGRLAFVDNYREIAARIREQLTACTAAEALAEADQHTNLGLRSTRPRVFVVASLAGGTGSGMFVDVAYLVRRFLKEMGHPAPDVVGLFFLPPPQHQASRPLAAGNAFAALAELYHFNAPGTTFAARYLVKEPPHTDAEPPFGRCMFLPLDPDDKKNRDLAGLAAGFLYRDLVTPLGRAADERRTADVPAAAKGAPLLEIFGMNRLAWPRRALVQQIARRLCLKIVQHWTAKDPEPIKATVEEWAKDQWAKRQLHADKLILSLKAACDGALDEKAPEDVFDGIAQRFAKEIRANSNPDVDQIRAALDEAERLVGQPESEKNLATKPPVLAESLENAAQALLTVSEQKLVEMAVHLVEQPRFRLVGAEEAVRQFNAILQQTIQQQETLCDDFLTKSNGLHARIHTLMEGIRAAAVKGRKAPLVAVELVELLRIYPTLRLRALILQRVLTVLRSMRGNCPEYLREFTFCRTRLSDLVKSFGAPLMVRSALNLGPGKELFPAGCTTLAETIDQFMAKVSDEELFELDQTIQNLLRRQFTALVHVCTTAANILRDLEAAMQQEMEAYVISRLGSANAVETFLSQYANEKAALAVLAEAHEAAAPPLTPESAVSVPELALVLVPTEAAADKVRMLARKALPRAHVTAGTKGDDIVIYREQPTSSLTDLPQTGREARQAYDTMRAAEHFTPHSRTDITDWRLPPTR